MTATTDSKPTHNRTHVAEVTMTVKRALVAVLLVASLLVIPSTARASGVVRTVCMSGCDYNSINDAVNQSNAGDFIKVMPGTYAEQVVVTVPLYIFAPADGPRPVITNSQSGSAVQIQPVAAGTTISHFDIRSTSRDNAALRVDGAVTATDLALTSAGGCAFLDGFAASQLGPGVTASTSSSDLPCIIAGVGAASDAVTGVTVNAPFTRGVDLAGNPSLTDSTVNADEAVVVVGGTVRRTTLNGAGEGLRVVAGPAQVSDSVVTSSLDGGVAVLAWPGAALELRNVTAIASGSSSTGLGALSASAPGNIGGEIDARNVIARGTANGAFGEPGTSSGCGGPCASGVVTLGYSNVNDPAGVIDTATVGHNQSVDPLLVNPAVGPRQDFHIASADSPVIGAGTPDASDGPSDRDGVAHPDPPAIGAYEYTGPPAMPSGGLPPGGGGTAGSGGGSVSTGLGGGSRRPTISQLTETRSVFAVAATSTPLRGRTPAASSKRGTTFLFRLDQPAIVTIVITTSAKCRRVTPRTARNLRCARAVARLARSAHAGFNKLAFSGRIRGKPLKPADYRAVFAATSAGGNSDPKILRFRIVGR